MSSIKPGDVVRCRCCGTPMTVFEIDGQQVGCGWFDGAQEFHRAVFAPEQVEFVR